MRATYKPISVPSRFLDKKIVSTKSIYYYINIILSFVLMTMIFLVFLYSKNMHFYV
jgi:hypothetical protein